MRFTLLLLLMTVSSAILNAQTVVQSIEAAEQSSIDISKIEEQYGDALNSEPDKGIFNNKQDEFINSYRQLIFDISSHLNKNDFKFEGNLRMFTRIYFNQKGTIDHFFYSNRQAGFSTEQEQQFNSLLQPFLSEYQFSQTADRPFAQCSPVVFAAGK